MNNSFFVSHFVCACISRLRRTMQNIQQIKMIITVYTFNPDCYAVVKFSDYLLIIQWLLILLLLFLFVFLFVKFSRLWASRFCRRKSFLSFFFFSPLSWTKERGRMFCQLSRQFHQFFLSSFCYRLKINWFPNPWKNVPFYYKVFIVLMDEIKLIASMIIMLQLILILPYFFCNSLDTHTHSVKWCCRKSFYSARIRTNAIHVIVFMFCLNGKNFMSNHIWNEYEIYEATCRWQ